MFLNMLEKANFLLTEYQVFDFPVPIHIIEQIIDDLNIKVIIINNLKHSCYIGDKLLIGKYDNDRVRESLPHEYCHINYHSMNQFSSYNITIAKNEAQATAFAAYFLMPVYVFEEALIYCANDYELAEEFGVSVAFVEYRKKLTQSLINYDFFEK